LASDRDANADPETSAAVAASGNGVIRLRQVWRQRHSRPRRILREDVDPDGQAFPDHPERVSACNSKPLAARSDRLSTPPETPVDRAIREKGERCERPSRGSTSAGTAMLPEALTVDHREANASITGATPGSAGSICRTAG
jgi:hypothetical protein